MKKKKNVCFVKLNVGAVSFSWCRATCSERARERGWHLSLSHSFTLTHSLCQFPLLSQSISLSLTKPGCDDSVTAPQKKKKKKKSPILKLKCGVLVKGGRAGGLCVQWVYVCLCVYAGVCVCQFVNVRCTLRLTGGGPREGKKGENLKMAWLMAWLPGLI